LQLQPDPSVNTAVLKDETPQYASRSSLVQFVCEPIIEQSFGGVYGGAGGQVPVLLQP
jgi:hypothetical protein